MTAPSTAPGLLARSLALVDVSRARSLAVEDQYSAAIAAAYTEALRAWRSSSEASGGSEEDSGSVLLTAALLVAVVSLLRRAYAAGASEGRAHARQQLGLFGVEASEAGEEIPDPDFIDALVSDFVRGQAEVSAAAGPVTSEASASELAESLQRRANIAVVAALYAARSAAALDSFQRAASTVEEAVPGRVHKLWVARFDLETPPCPMCVRLHGMHVPLGEEFSVLPTERAPYGDVLSGPPRHPRCRCHVVLYLPDAMESVLGPSPQAMAAYADRVLATHQCPRNAYVAATIVHVKPYTRVVNGKTQQVSGYYYDIQTGMKIPESQIGNAPVQEVSKAQAKALAEKSKGAVGAKLDPTKTKFGPGVYEVSLQDGSKTQVIVHKDGSSTATHGSQAEDSDPAATNQFLSYWEGQGAVSKISDDPDTAEDPETSTPLEPSAKAKAEGTVPPGEYLISGHGGFGGVVVNDDGTGELYSKDFSKSKKLTKKAVQSIATHSKWSLVEVEDDEFKSDFEKELDAANAAQKEGGEPKFPEPQKQPGAPTLSGPTLFQVGTHQVQFEMGSQVFAQKAGKDTLYVLDPKGDVTKYNPQGKGVQATLVASAEDPAARANLVAKLTNVTDQGMAVKNPTAAPGTGSAVLGGVSVTSQQLGDAISALLNSPSPAVGSVLAKVGSPLATTDFHAVAAPHKAQFNNKTKPAFLAALTLAVSKIGHTPPESMGAVAHLETDHGLSEHQASLGGADVTAIHDALHAAEPSLAHHEAAGPGLIDFSGVPATPEQVQTAIDALKAEKSTSVKKPLKSAGSVLAAAPLQQLANEAAGKTLHYGKLKPAVIDVLQKALDEHQTKAPPTQATPVAEPPVKVTIKQMSGTPEQLAAVRSALADIAIEELPQTFHVYSELKEKLPGNPFTNLSLVSIAEDEKQGPTQPHELNALLDAALGKKLAEVGYESTAAPSPAAAPSGPESPSLSLRVGESGKVKGTLAELVEFRDLLENAPTVVGLEDELPDNPFAQVSVFKLADTYVKMNPDSPSDSSKADALAYLQAKIDQAVQQQGPSPAAPESVTLDGVSVNKADLDSAIAALQAETSTSVKKPLKAMDHPLAAADLRMLAEEHAGAKLHYSKLKGAVVAMLQARSAELSEPPAPPPDVPEQPVVTKVGEDLPEPSAPSLPPDLTEPVEAAETDNSGVYLFKDSGGASLMAYPDGSFVLVGGPHFPGNEPYPISQESFEEMLSAGTLTKVSDTPVDSTWGSSDGVSWGKYLAAPSSGGVPVTYDVLLGGQTVVSSPHGQAVVPTALVKSQVLSLGADPQQSASSAEWLASQEFDDAGAFVKGTYTHINGKPYVVDASGPALEDGSPVVPELFAALLSGGWVTLAPPDQQQTAEPPEKINGLFVGEYVSPSGAGTATVSPFGQVLDSSGFYLPVGVFKNNLAEGTYYKVGKYKNNFNDSEVLVIYSDGSAVQVGPEGSKPAAFSLTSPTTLDVFGQVYEFIEDLPASLPEPEPEPVNPTALAPGGLTPEGNKVGIYVDPKTGDKFELLADGSVGYDDMELGEYDDPTFIADDLIKHGEVVFVSPPEAPAPVGDANPSAGAIKLTPLTISHKVGFLDKSQMLKVAQQWAGDAGYDGIAAQHLGSLKKDSVLQWLTHWSKGEWDKAFEIEASKVKKHKALKSHPGSPSNPSNATGFVKKKMASAVDGEVPAGTLPPGNWPELSMSNYGPSGINQWDPDLIDKYLLAAGMQNPTGLSDYSKKWWVKDHYFGDKIATDQKSVQGQKNAASGAHLSEPITPDVPQYPAGMAVPAYPDWAPFDPSKSSAKNLTNAQLDQYLNHVAPKSTAQVLKKQPEDVKQQLVQLHYVAGLPSAEGAFRSPAEAKKLMSELVTKANSVAGQHANAQLTGEFREVLSVKEHTYTRDKTQPSGLNGHTEIIQVTDEGGRTFLFKVAQEPFRADIEHATHQLASLVGHTVADSRLGTFEGKFGQFQAKLDSKATLQGISVPDLPVSALQDVVNSHVFDWMVSNDDAAGRNFLLSPDGKRVYPIDLGRAFAMFGKPGQMQLKRGKTSALESTYYDKIYGAAVSGQLPEEDVDKLYQSMIATARRLKGADPERFSEILSAGLERRSNYTITSASDREELISQVLARKAALVEDFEAFWDGLYAEMGREKPSPATALSAHVFTGVSEGHLARAKDVGAGGAATFFGGAELEDGHFLAQFVSKSAAPSTGAPPSPQQTYQGYPTGEWVSDAEISVFLNPDGTVDGMEDAESDLDHFELFKTWVEGGELVYAGEQASGSAVAGEGQELWLSGQLRNDADAALTKWLEEHASNTISAASSSVPPQSEGEKILASLGYDNAFGAVTNAAKTVSHHNKMGDTNYNTQRMNELESLRSLVQKHRDAVTAGNYPAQITSAEDKTQFNKLLSHYESQINKIDDLIATKGMSSPGDFAAFTWVPTAKSEVTAEVTPAIKVKHISNYLEISNLDANNNLVLTGETNSSAYQGQAGNGFQVDLPDGTQIEYRPWSPSYGVKTSQQGQLKVKVRNYDGVGSVSAAMDALRTMGLNLNDADDTDLELQYWRSLYGVLSDRRDRTEGVYAKAAKKAQAYKLGGAAPPGLTREQEIDRWREVWSEVNPQAVDLTVAEKRYLPRFSHPNPNNPHIVGGQPHWRRFDASDDWSAKKPLAVASVSGTDALTSIVKTGGYYSTEDRVKVLGRWSAGMSSVEDQATGAAGFAFVRQGGDPGYQYQIYFDPDVLARTSTYQFAGDNFGKIQSRSDQSYFDLEKATKYTTKSHGSNEAMIKHGMTLLDDIEMLSFPTVAQRDEAIASLHARGIYEIRGLPVEARLVLTKNVEKAAQTVEKHRRERLKAAA